MVRLGKIGGPSANVVFRVVRNGGQPAQEK
jgi:hypothetical protein